MRFVIRAWQAYLECIYSIPAIASGRATIVITAAIYDTYIVTNTVLAIRA